MKFPGGVRSSDLAIASVASVIPGSLLGFVVSPGVLIDFSYLAIRLAPIAVVATLLAIPISLFCFSIQKVQFLHSLFAGAILGSVHSIIGEWYWDCREDCTFFATCAEQPVFSVFFYGVPFGLASSSLYWAVLRQRRPEAFGEGWPLRNEEIFKLVIAALALGAFVSWSGFFGGAAMETRGCR